MLNICSTLIKFIAATANIVFPGINQQKTVLFKVRDRVLMVQEEGLIEYEPFDILINIS